MEAKFYEVLVGTKIINNLEKTLSVFSPINNQLIGTIPRVSTREEISIIYRNAKFAFYKYRDVKFEKRKEMLLRFATLLKENWDEISNIIVWETAKSKHSAIQEIDRSIDYIKATIDEYEQIIKNPLIMDENVHGVKGKVGKFIYEPLGVVLAISPFNYPLNLLITKIAPALISGNAVVYKPATQGSCLGAFLSFLFYKAGYVNGEISCVIGKGSEIGDWLIEDRNIDMISFTGSSLIGKKVAICNPLIPVVLELGGKDAAIVLENSDLKLAANKIVKGAFEYNGQRCTAIKRVLVDEKVRDELIKLIDEEISHLKIGSASEGNYDITEMIDSKALKYNLELLLDAYKKGAKTNQIIKKKGNILYPIALYNVPLHAAIASEEQFGPILPIISFKDIEEAIDICNNSEYGLQTSIFTKDIKLATKIAQLLDVVTVNINRSSSRGPDIFPFGGIKNSGKGLQGIRDSIISMNRKKGIIENE